jgi:hypothetical protein
MFYLTFLGQTVVAISQIFVLGVPALLAATWFPAHQACTVYTTLNFFPADIRCHDGQLFCYQVDMTKKAI